MTTRNILVEFPSSFSPRFLLRVQVVQTSGSTDTAYRLDGFQFHFIKEMRCSRWSVICQCKCFSSAYLPSRLGMYNTSTASLQRGMTPSINQCTGYDIKKADAEFPVIQELPAMQSNPPLSSLSGLL